MYQIIETNITIKYTKNTHESKSDSILTKYHKMKIGLLVIYSICNRESRVFTKKNK